MKRLRWALLALIGLPLALYTALRWAMAARYGRRIYPIERVPARPVAMVLGAGVYPNGRLSDLLMDRLDTGIALFRSGRVDQLLLTADDRPVHQRQTTAMAGYTVEHGIPAGRLILDPVGSRTYASCYRARYHYGLTSLIVVTQHFHLHRSLYLCERLGLEAVGVAADHRPYRWLPLWVAREALAWVAAWRDGWWRLPPRNM